MDERASRPHDWREWRRWQAVSLAEQGWPRRAIATALGVTKTAVSQWLAAWQRGGSNAVGAHPSPGRPTRLVPEQKRLIPEFLSHGAEAYGFRGEVWTCARIGKVIEWEFGVRYSRSQVSRVMKQLQWTPQIPLTQALQRNDAEIETWCRETWPHLKHIAHRQHRTLVFVDESGFYLLPGVVKTYAPKGRTPILKEWQSHDHLAVISGIIHTGKLYTLVRQTALTGTDCVCFLQHLLRQTARRLLVIWDGSPIHRGPDIRNFLAEDKRHDVRLEHLPPYAPDLNPDEGLWQHLKHVEMRNVTCLDLEELHLQYHLAVGRVRQKPRLIQSFFAGAGLDSRHR
jgi:transposase